MKWEPVENSKRYYGYSKPKMFEAQHIAYTGRQRLSKLSPQKKPRLSETTEVRKPSLSSAADDADSECPSYHVSLSTFSTH